MNEDNVDRRPSGQLRFNACGETEATTKWTPSIDLVLGLRDLIILCFKSPLKYFRTTVSGNTIFLVDEFVRLALWWRVDFLSIGREWGALVRMFGRVAGLCLLARALDRFCQAEGGRESGLRPHGNPAP
jgi:hypothetical protein